MEETVTREGLWVRVGVGVGGQGLALDEEKKKKNTRTNQPFPAFLQERHK